MSLRAHEASTQKLFPFLQEQVSLYKNVPQLHCPAVACSAGTELNSVRSGYDHQPPCISTQTSPPTRVPPNPPYLSYEGRVVTPSPLKGGLRHGGRQADRFTQTIAKRTDTPICFVFTDLPTRLLKT